MKRILLMLILAIGVLTGCQDKKTIAELEKLKAGVALGEQNKAVAEKYLNCMNSKDSSYVGLLAADYKYYFPSGNPNPLTGAGDLANAKNIWKACPDIYWKLEDLVVDGDKIVLRYLATGTQQGELMGIPPSGKKFQFTGIMILKFENGKVVEQREEADMFGFMGQMGMELKPAEKKK
jgi:predicted ester cyclase